MIAGNPDDLCEALAQQLESLADAGGILGHIAGNDQPILWKGWKFGEGLHVGGAAEVQVADRQQFHKQIPAIVTGACRL